MSPSTASGVDSASLAQRQLVDKLCLEFEDVLRAGGAPQIEAYLARVSPPETDVLLSELLVLEWDYLVRSGNQLSCSAYLARFSAHERVLRRLLVKTGLVKRSLLAVGSRIGRYTVKSLIGRGAFGAVYLAWDETLERHVAVKESWADPSESTADLERNLTEARSIAKLQHPGIVGVYDVLDDQHGLPLIVMEYVEGPTLLEAVRSASFTTESFLQLIIRIADAIGFAHERGFVHRDLKPSNIRLDARGEPRILDFGLAVHESVQRSKAGESAGSLAYMSPEQVLGDTSSLDGRADIWALGVMMYEVFAQRSPFGGERTTELAVAVLCSEPKPIRQIQPAIPRELERICLKCLRKPLTERYSTAGDLAQDLREFLHAGDEPSVGRNPKSKQLRTRRYAGWGIAAAITAAIAVMLIGLWQKHAVPLDATVDLQVWDPIDVSRRGVGIRDPRATPLRAGDQVRLHVTMTRPAYACVLWIDSRGHVSPVYPWENGDWQRAPRLEAKVNVLRLPAPVNEAWTMEDGPDGMETVVVLLRDVPWLRVHPSLESRCRFRPQTASDCANVVEWKNGVVRVRSTSRTRAADLGKTRELVDPVVTNQALLSKSLDERFSLHYALSFPFAAAK